MHSIQRISLFVAVISITNIAAASTGIYATGYGTQEQGMGGAGIAVGESALAPAENPAGIAFSGDRLDIGAGMYIIRGGAQQDGITNAAKTGFSPMPEFGYVKTLAPHLVFGVASWSSGASMNYGYPFGGIQGNSNTYSQGVFAHVAPTLAYRIDSAGNHVIAFSAVGALSTIRVDGIEAQSGQPNQGRDWKPGYGFKVGWLSRITPQFSAGAFYASEIRYQPWSKYSHIFPDGGRMVEPEQYGAGVAYRPTEQWLLAFDWVRFNYGKTHVLGNSINFTVPLGDVNGSGFGFANVNAYRFGVQYQVTAALTVRAGFEITDQVVTSRNTAFTFLVPSTMNHTYTLGATYRFGRDSELSFAYAVAPRVQVDGTGPSTGTNTYGQNQFIALSYTRKF